MKRTRSENCLSDLTLDMLRVDELTPDAATRAHQHLDECSLCRSRTQEITRDADESELPPLHPAVAPLHVQPLLQPSRRAPWGIAAGLSLAAAALAVIVIGRPDGSSTSLTSIDAPSHKPDLAPTTRTKGGPTLMFHVKRDGVVWEGGPHELLQPGDTIRFSYSWSEPGSVAVLSRDGAGVVSVYTAAGDDMLRTVAGEEMALPSAVRLDHVTGPETFYGVFCTEPVATESLKQVLMKHSDTPVIPGCMIDLVRVEKRAIR